MPATIEIVGDDVRVTDGRQAPRTAPLAKVIAQAAARVDRVPSCGVLPDGVRYWKDRGDAVAMAIEIAPHTRTVRWVSDDSPIPFGSSATYTRRTLAFPFIVMLVVLRNGSLTGWHQLFYRTRPLQQDTELLLPNLLNVSPDSYEQKAWLCLLNMPDIGHLSWPDKVRAIGEHVFCGGWNLSSDVHEGASYFTRMTELDPRIASADAWEQASAADPWFPLEIPWQGAGLTLEAELDRMLGQIANPEPVANADDVRGILTRIQCNGGKASTRSSE